MNRNLFALLTSDDHRSLAMLARAIRVADRRDHLPVWRSFVLRLVR